MVHEAMVLEDSGRHLAMIELAVALKLLLTLSIIACIFFPFGLDGPGPLVGLFAYAAKLGVAAILLGNLEVTIPKMRVFRVPELSSRPHARAARHASPLCLAGALIMGLGTMGLGFDIAHMLAGFMVLAELPTALPGRGRGAHECAPPAQAQPRGRG